MNAGDFVMPGDEVIRVSSMSKQMRIGPGLVEKGDSIVALQAGVLCSQERPAKIWVDSYQKRYVPVVGDPVIGIIVKKHIEDYVVDIGAAAWASLSIFGFEGATKRNRPMLQIGSIVYARVSAASRDFDPEIVCVALGGRKEMFGELSGGYHFKCSLSLARLLLRPKCPVADSLGTRIPFEMTVGINGRVWVKSSSMKNTILISMALKRSEGLPSDKVDQLVETTIKHALEDRTH